MAIQINEDLIEDEAIEAEFHHIKSQYERALQVACCERDPEFRGYAKQNLIGRALIHQEARRSGPDVTPEEVEEAYQDLIRQHGGEAMFLLNMGMPSDNTEFARAGVERSLRMERFLAELQPESEPSEETLRAHFEQNIDLFLTPEEVRAVHISKSLRSASSRDEIFEKMREIRNRLLDGADFMEIAAVENDQEGQEIDLGFFRRGSFMEEFETIAFSLRVEELSPVFTTQLGFHICKVTERKEPAPPPFEEVRDDVAQVWLAEERDREVKALVERLRQTAAIEDLDPDPDEIPVHHHA